MHFLSHHIKNLCRALPDPSNLPMNDNQGSFFEHSDHETERDREIKDGKVVSLINIHSVTEQIYLNNKNC